MVIQSLAFLVIGFLFFLVGYFLFSGTIKLGKKHKESQTWPKVTGRITGSKVIEPSMYGNDTHTYRAELTYRYVALGNEYQGWAEVLKESYGEADQAIKLISSEEFLVRYNPEKPAESATAYSTAPGKDQYVVSFIFFIPGVFFLVVAILYR